ncbi:MAG TPA: DUF1641 domain-containing protein [Polyangiaceae bacterium LLY-WYZ-15_(1-7)]|nr:hypothetical protein [Myxococcales bacterium]MAT28937.1 hypothetical protein [Sandaracinus sp.]HJL00942.1 DUF1641 domain-containing protein [Polyangiaceae bacterium LLY-WYZ-15_(1-7)]MBJ73067.1 hypothetical protein [Sandaracinus sp.]HJL12284.1 DUF1641 domain-containing protein [Polyangiaceae bacterium LLY-WYZ-15_(1-7)]
MTMTSVAAGKKPNGSPPADLHTTLRRIDERLARLEAALEPVAELTAQAPALVATAGDIADEWASDLGDVDERVRALGDVLERLTRPQTLASLRKVVDLAESAPDLIATLGDVLDETMAEAAEQGLELTHLVDDAKRLTIGLLKLTTSPELRALLDSGMLDPKALMTLGAAARSVANASDVEPPKVGLFGAMRALRDGDVQRAVGFVLKVAGGFGQSLRRTDKRLGS